MSATDPKELTSAAQVLGEAAAQVPAGSVLAGWFDDFTSQCKYGTVEVEIYSSSWIGSGASITETSSGCTR